MNQESGGVQKVKKKFKTASQNRKVFENSDPLRTMLVCAVQDSVKDMGLVSVPVMLLPDNFKAYRKVRVENNLFTTDNLPCHYTVKEYAPMVFRCLRERFHVSEEQYSQIQLRTDDAQTPFHSKRTMLSFCKRFLLLQLDGDAFLAILHSLKQYYEYVVEKNGHVVLLQMLALFRITIGDNKHYFLTTRPVPPLTHLPPFNITPSLQQTLTLDLQFLASANLTHYAVHVHSPTHLTLLCFVPLHPSHIPLAV